MTAITKTEAKPLAVQSDITDLLRMAVEKNLDVDKLERLQQMYYAEQDRRAKAAYLEAIARFQAECPAPKKTRQGQHASDKGGLRSGWYAPLDEITETIRKTLEKCDLSYRWGDAVVTEGKMTRTCIVSHVGGHSESSSMTVPVDSTAGASPQQKYGAADTYARRYSLIAALGLTTCDEDTDADEANVLEPITNDQVIELQDLIEATNADTKAFCRVYGIASVSALPQHLYQPARRMLEGKRK